MSTLRIFYNGRWPIWLKKCASNRQKKQPEENFGLNKENFLGVINQAETYFFLALALVHLVANAPKSLMRFKRSVPPLVRL